MPRALVFLPILFLALGACGDDAADYPRLLPTAQILAEPQLPPHAGAAATEPGALRAGLGDRARDLRARADALRGPVIEPGFRRAMQAARARHS